MSKAPATQSPNADGAATSEYLRAREALIRASGAALQGALPLENGLVGHVSSDCPGALRGTPAARLRRLSQYKSAAQRRAALQAASISIEVERALEAVEQQPQEAAFQSFLEKAESIRWDDPRITELVHTFAEIERQRHSQPGPDVCQTIKAWVESGYRKLPAVPVAAEPSGDLGRRWASANAALGCGKFAAVTPTQVLRALKSPRQPGAGPTVRDVEEMEVRLAFEESRARSSAARALRQALGLPPSARRPAHRRHRGALPALIACSGKPERLSEPVNVPSGT